MHATAVSRAATLEADPLLDQARSALGGLGNPLIRYNWEACNVHVEELKVACVALELRDGNRRWQGLRTAIESTDKFLLEFHYDLSKFQHLVNMPERMRWLRAEFDYASGSEVPRADLQKYRHWFTETHGAMNLWNEQAIQAGRMIRIGMFRKEIREMRDELRKCEQAFDGVPDKQAAGTFHEWVCHVHLFNSCARGDLYEVQRVVKKGLELIPELEKFTQICSEFNWTVGRAADPKQHFKAYLEKATVQVDHLEREARIIFADELDLPLLRDRQLGVSIYEETGSPRSSVVQELRSMMSEWLIDYDKPTPQRGFGRVYAEQEIEDFCGKHKGRLFRVAIDSVTIGFYLIFTAASCYPPHVNEAMEAVEKSGDYMSALTGWTEMVGITHAGRDIAKSRNLDLYSLLHEAVRDTFASFQAEKLYGEVREGTYANLSKSDHLKRGWDETGVIVITGPQKLPYQVLRMVLSPGGMWGPYGGG